MLKKKAIRKILITTITIVIVMMVYFIPNDKNDIKSLNIKDKIEYQTINVGYIYLLNDNNFLVKVNTLLSNDNNLQDRVIEIINRLINSNTNPKGLKNYIPKNTKIIDIEIDNGNLSINFSKDILKVDESLQEKLIEGIVYSLFELKEIEKIQIYVEDENISNYFKMVPDVITREFGINKMYYLNGLNDIQKVVVYYLSEIDNNKYMVPVTKYISNKEDRIKIIIENLSSSYIYEPNLISLLNPKTELINYEIIDDIMLLNFNKNILGPKGSILEEVVYTICDSVFDTYDVNKLILNVDNRTIKEIVK